MEVPQLNRSAKKGMLTMADTNGICTGSAMPVEGGASTDGF